MPLMGSGLYADELAAPTDTGELAAGDDDAFVVVSTFPVLRDARDARVDVLLLCGVAAVRENVKGGEPVDETLPPRPGWRNAKGYRLGTGWPRLESELDARPENEDGSSLERGCASSSSSNSTSSSSSSTSTTISPSSSSPSPS